MFMNRLFCFLFVLCLLLSGCTSVIHETTAPTTVPTTAPSIPETKPSLYLPEDPIETETDGAVRAYQVDADCNEILFMGKQMLLLSNDGYGPSILTLLDSKNKSIAQSVELRGGITLHDIRTSWTRCGYYSALDKSIVILDEQLREMLRVQVPADMTGTPVLPADLSEAYYVSGTDLRVLNLESGLSRLLRQRKCKTISIDAILFNDSVLQCTVTETDDSTYTEFISTETGESLGRDEHLLFLSSWKNKFLLQRMDGTVLESLVGEYGSTMQSFSCEDGAQLHSALAAGSVVMVSQKQETTTLCLYTLSDGLKQAEVLLESLHGVRQITAEPGSKNVWFLAENMSGVTALYCWDPAASQIEDSKVYIDIRYTKAEPDTAGLAQCRAYADSLQEQYGVDIWLEREKIYSDGYVFDHEYQPRAFMNGLNALEEALSQFPEGFFETLGSVSDSAKLHIALVRSLTGRSVAVSRIADGAQYWLNGKSCIVLAIGDTTQQEFYRTLSLALDTYILNNSLAYDDWNQWNPSGFEYDENYKDYSSKEDSEFLTGEDRAFVNAMSMTFPREDRAAIFACALMDGNEAVFQSETLQAKLRQICKGIREAFEWKRDERVFPWEQYLNESLAYVK